MQDFVKSLVQKAPNALLALGLVLVAGIVAGIVRTALGRMLGSLKPMKKLEGEGATLVKTLSELGFAVVWLLFLPGIFQLLGVDGLTAPIQSLTTKMMAFLPNILAAGLIFFVGMTVAKVLRGVVSGLLASAGLDKLAERVGISGALGKQNLSGVIGTIVYALILLPILIAGLQALKLDAITLPATAMLGKILSGLPNFFAATVTVGIAFVIGKIVAGVVANILSGIGFDAIPEKLGLTTKSENSLKASELVGTIVLVSTLVFATIEAANLLGFTSFAALVQSLLVVAGQVLGGIVVLAIGLYLANMVAGLIKASGVSSADRLALVARIGILTLVGAMGLRQMGIASDIINMTFGLTLGAVAVAAAIAFGIGGRDAASRILDGAMNKISIPDGAEVVFSHAASTVAKAEEEVARV